MSVRNFGFDCWLSPLTLHPAPPLFSLCPPFIATFLATIMVVVNGNPLTGMVSIAGKDKRVGSFLGRQIPGGLGEHNKYEIDHSLTRNDAYFGEYWKLNGTLYEEMFKVADEVSGLGAGKGVVTPHSLAIYRNNRYKESVATNPDFTFAPLGVLFFGADQFVWRSHVSADSNGKLLPATRENVASFYGAKDTGNGTWEYVPVSRRKVLKKEGPNDAPLDFSHRASGVLCSILRFCDS